LWGEDLLGVDVPANPIMRRSAPAVRQMLNARNPIMQASKLMLPSGQQIYSMPPLMPPGGMAGLHPISGKRLPLGFGLTRFISTTGLAVVQVTARPQVPCRPARLIVEVIRSGATSTGAVTIQSITVGTRNQFIGAAAVPAGAFAAGAFDATLLGDAAQPGVDVTIVLAISLVPTAPDFVDVTPVVFCDAVA